jgi:hypothetical protein
MDGCSEYKTEKFWENSRIFTGKLKTDRLKIGIEQEKKL